MDEGLRIILEGAAEELVRGETGEGFEAFGEVVGVEESGEVEGELTVAPVVVGANGGLFDRAVHAFDLAVGPGMVGFGEAVVDVETCAGEFESVGSEEFTALESEFDVGGGGAGVAWSSEVGTVVGEDGVDAVRESFLQSVEKGGSFRSSGARNQAGESEFGSAIDGDEEEELTLGSADFGQIKVKVTDGVGFEFFACRSRGVEMREAADALALEATVESGTGEMWDGGLEGVETVVERQEGVFAKSDGDGFLGEREGGGAAHLWPHGEILDGGALFPFENGLGVDAVTLSEAQEARLTMLDRATHRRRRAGAAVKNLSHKARGESSICTFTPSLFGTKHLERFN